MIQNCTNLKENVLVCIVGFKYLELSGVDKKYDDRKLCK